MKRKKKIKIEDTEVGDVFRRKGERRLCMRDSGDFYVAQVLTGKKRGAVLYNLNGEEFVTPVKVKIVEVK